MEIKPLIGLGNIEFGLGRYQIRKRLGKADYISTHPMKSRPIKAVTFHYNDLKTHISFSEETNFVVKGIQTRSHEITYKDVPLFEVSEDKIRNIIPELEVLYDLEEVGKHSD